MLISGKFLPRHLPCNDFRQLPNIVTFSQLSEALFRSGLNFRLVAVQHIGLVLLDEANELPTGQVLASIQPLPVFLGQLISGAKLFGLVHKIQLLCAVCLFHILSLDSRVNGFHRSGHRTADHAGHESDHEIIQRVRERFFCGGHISAVDAGQLPFHPVTDQLLHALRGSRRTEGQDLFQGSLANFAFAQLVRCLSDSVFHDTVKPALAVCLRIR